jgi:hypothetical protein
MNAIHAEAVRRQRRESGPTPQSGTYAALARMCGTLALLVGTLGAQPTFAQTAHGPRLQLDFLDRLVSEADEVVDVTVDPAMLQTAAGLLPKGKEKDADTFRALVEAIKGIYVKSFEFARDGGYTDADVERVRSQLKEPWTRTVTVRSRKDREIVEVYFWREGSETGGLAVVVAEPRELTIVNIVGRVDMKVLGALQGFGVPLQGLGLPAAASPKRLPPPPSPPPLPR